MYRATTLIKSDLWSKYRTDMGYTASKGSRDSTRCNFPFNFSTIESRTGINCATCDRNYRFLTEKEKKVYLQRSFEEKKKERTIPSKEESFENARSKNPLGPKFHLENPPRLLVRQVVSNISGEREGLSKARLD